MTNEYEHEVSGNDHDLVVYETLQFVAAFFCRSLYMRHTNDRFC